jgi:hypothetical protein
MPMTRTDSLINDFCVTALLPPIAFASPFSSLSLYAQATLLAVRCGVVATVVADRSTLMRPDSMCLLVTTVTKVGISWSSNSHSLIALNFSSFSFFLLLPFRSLCLFCFHLLAHGFAIWAVPRADIRRLCTIVHAWWLPETHRLYGG